MRDRTFVLLLCIATVLGLIGISPNWTGYNGYVTIEAGTWLSTRYGIHGEYERERH
jgi:hypothetical protein